MHHGVFHGKFTDKLENHILILGESHHISTNLNVITDKIAGIPASYTTASVVHEHLENRHTHDFLTKIAKTFGVIEDGEDVFWNSVYFGNYIDVLCGIGNSVAKQQIEDNREKYNDQLFRFVNEHNISKIFCFSVLAYMSLPALGCGEESKQETLGIRGNKRIYLRQCQYKAGVQHTDRRVVLQQGLQVYGISHPSAKGGYPLDLFAEKLTGKI